MAASAMAAELGSLTIINDEWQELVDLRRSFGYRYSRRVMPAVLRELMRHAKVETTIQYYVGNDAKRTAADLWAMDVAAHFGPGDHLGDHAESGEEESEENACF